MVGGMVVSGNSTQKTIANRSFQSPKDSSGYFRSKWNVTGQIEKNISEYAVGLNQGMSAEAAAQPQLRQHDGKFVPAKSQPPGSLPPDSFAQRVPPAGFWG